MVDRDSGIVNQTSNTIRQNSTASLASTITCSSVMPTSSIGCNQTNLPAGGTGNGNGNGNNGSMSNVSGGINRPATKCKDIRVGFYDIKETIGKGNFAVVKLARHRVTKNEVSFVYLKILFNNS